MTRWAPIACLAACVPLLLAPTCGTTSPSPSTTPHLDLVGVFPTSTGYFLQLDLWVDTTQLVQAADIQIDWQGASLAIRPLMDPEFDDDGLVLGGPLPVEVLTPPYQIADVRHGDSAVTGAFGLVSIWVRAPSGGDAQLTTTVTLARPDGSRIQTAPTSVSYSP